MNLLPLIERILPYISIAGILDRVHAILIQLLLSIDAAAYDLVAYSFKIFQIMCTLNYNSIYGLISPIIESLRAVMIVYIVYLLGVGFIQYMLDPNKAAEGGKKMLINLFIASALFVSYNFVFNVFNELNIALVGNPTGYKYETLKDVFDLTEADKYGAKDEGVVMRLLFGKDKIDDPGKSIAVGLAGAFIRDAGSDSYNIMLNYVRDKDGMEGLDDYDLAMSIVDKEVTYTRIVGFVVALFVVWNIFKASVQVGIRMFKLLILQIVAPIVFVDVIKNGLQGKFKTWASKFFSVSIEAFVRMFTIMLITVFVCKFLIHIDTFFPAIDGDVTGRTKFLIKVLIVIAAYMFSGEATSFIDEVLGTKLSNTKGSNFLKGVIGGGLGAITGAVGGVIGGAIGGGFGGAIGGLFSGATKGIASGAKGKNVADLIKGGVNAGKGGKTLGRKLYNQGNGNALAGLGAGIAGAVGNATGVGNRLDKQLDQLNNQSEALDALDAAEKFAVKNTKLGDSEDDASYGTWTDAEGNQRSFADRFLSGAKEIKLGEDKDSYVSQMVDYDTEYQEAISRYDALQNDSSFAKYADDYKEYESQVDAINNATMDNHPAEYVNLAGEKVQINTEEDLAKYKEDQLKEMSQLYSEAISAQKTLSDARNDVQNKKSAAEKRIGDYYNHRKDYEGNRSDDVRSKRQAYLDAGGKDVSGSGRTSEKKRIHKEKTDITNSREYKYTHLNGKK